jgi:hypothetical protein
MSLLYHPNIKRVFAERGIRLGLCGSITVYSGTQPTPQTVINNWTQYNANSSACLWHGTNTIWSLQNSLVVYASTLPKAFTPYRAGTATWCILWGISTVAGTAISDVYYGNNNGGLQAVTPQIGSSTIATTKFIIADVSSSAGTGVVRFSSVNFTTASAIQPVDIGITIA